MHKIGIDFGGTKIEGLILNEDGSELFRKRIATEQGKGYPSILMKVTHLYRELVEHIQGSPHTLGMGTPGAISLKTGLLKNSNTVCLNGKPFKQDLEKMLGREVKIENDANCFVMAEALHGAARGHHVVFGVIMGTGCGGGIFYNGQVVEGLQKIAGEWGHMSIDPAGPTCYCGSRGCVETFISGSGLQRQYEALHGEKVCLEEIVNLFRQGDEKVTELMDRFFDNYGRAIGNLINILDPDMIVLGGGVSNIDELYTLGAKKIKRHVFSDSLETPVVKNQLGDSSGVIGAALIGI